MLLVPLFAALLAAAPQIAGDEERPVVGFEGSPGEPVTVTGRSVIEHSPRLVREGSGSLRLICAPTERYPGIRVTGDVLRQSGWTTLAIDVLNPGAAAVPLGVRIDDDHSAGVEAEIFRTSVTLHPGWNTVRTPLDHLKTTSGTRELAATELAAVAYFVAEQTERTDLIFDNMRFTRAAGSAARGFAEAQCKTFAAGWPQARALAEKFALVTSLTDVDTPERVQLLGELVLAQETDARVIDRAIRVLGTTRHDASVAAAVRAATAARGVHRWRWCDALGRMHHAAAAGWLRTMADQGAASSDQTAAILALARRDDASVIPLCGIERGGTWQVRAARVSALRTVGGLDAASALIGFLSDESGRVRLDARQALAAVGGDDLGDAPSTWLAWLEARRAGRGAHGGSTRPRGYAPSYYGIELGPQRIAFVIDLSGSMTAVLSRAAQDFVRQQPSLISRHVVTRLDLAREELVSAIEKLPTDAAFNIVFFASGVEVWRKEVVVKATAEARADAIARVRRVAPRGSTNMYGALMAAFEPDTRISRTDIFRDSVDTVFLLTDGDPTVGAITDIPHLVADIADRNRSRVVKFHTIGVGSPDAPLLRDLAAATGGTYVDLAK